MRLCYRGIAAAIFAVVLVAPFPLFSAPLTPALAPAAPPDSASSGLIESAQRQFDAGNYTLAIATLQSAIGVAPSNADAYYWLGRCYYELRDYDNAVAQLEKAISLDSQNSVYHQWLGRAYGGKADKERSFSAARKVKSEFEAAVQFDPKNITARRDLEEYCMDAPWIVGGNKDESAAQVTAIAALDPVEGHLARAAYDVGALKKPEQADSEYRQVLAATPHRIEPYLEAADFWVKQNKPQDAGAAVEAAATKASSGDPRIAYYRGVVDVLSAADLAGAETLLKSYVASTPDRSDWPSHASARYWMGRLDEAQGKRAEAAEQYRAALELDPGMKDARARLENLEQASQ
ncbi:MAG: tetratricopeptide repeat protein [Candidatus Acidiferrales bacterium]